MSPAQPGQAPIPRRDFLKLSAATVGSLGALGVSRAIAEGQPVVGSMNPAAVIPDGRMADAFDGVISHACDFMAFPRQLPALTAHLRVHLGDKGWNTSLTEWVNDDGSIKSLRVYTRRADDSPWDAIEQNYHAFTDAAGNCDVLEVEVRLNNHNPSWSAMRVGVPAARIGKDRIHDIVVRFNGVSLALFIDGVMVDENWPLGMIPCGSYLKNAEGTDVGLLGLQIFPRALCDKEIIERSGGSAWVEQRTREILGPVPSQMQYWTPPGHNQWVGDVMFGDLRSFDPDRIHLYYLIDRRHSTSKFGTGGHFTAHMSSTDLVHWEHHPLALAPDEWTSFATGRPLVRNGKVIMGYGMHSSRIHAEKDLFQARLDPGSVTIPRIFQSAGRMIPGEPDAGKYPMGSTFAESTDGINFQKSHLLIHPAQNPSIVKESAGDGFLMLAGYGGHGLWRSADLCHWHPVDQDIIPLWGQSSANNTDECQCYFEWNGWHYIVGGRTGFWMSKNQNGPYWEGPGDKKAAAVKPRWSLNDGLWVPMVAEFKGNRRILAGFLTGPGFEWAGHLVFRELIQMAVGSLGLNWPAEMRPSVTSMLEPEIRGRGKVVRGSQVAVAAAPASWATLEGLPHSIHLHVRITPDAGTSHVAIAGLGANGAGCALSCLVRRGRAQWSESIHDSLPREVPSLEEINGRQDHNSPNIHWKGQDFTITNVDGMETSFDLEMVFRYDAKSMSTLIDACIGDHRTLITRRKGLELTTIRLLADGPATFEILTLGCLKA